MIQLEMFQQKKEKCRYRLHYDLLKWIANIVKDTKINVVLLFNLTLQKFYIAHLVSVHVNSQPHGKKNCRTKKENNPYFYYLTSLKENITCNE